MFVLSDTFPDIYNHGDDDTPALYDARPKTALSFRAGSTVFLLLIFIDWAWFSTRPPHILQGRTILRILSPFKLA